MQFSTTVVPSPFSTFPRVPPTPIAELHRWGYLIPFITRSLDGVFQGCFSRAFTFKLAFLSYWNVFCSFTLVFVFLCFIVLLLYERRTVSPFTPELSSPL